MGRRAALWLLPCLHAFTAPRAPRPARPALRSASTTLGPNGRAGPLDAPPVYDDSGLLNRTLLAVFRDRVADELGERERDDLSAWDGLIELVHRLNVKGPTPRATREGARRILNNCFPALPSPTRGFAWRPLPEAFRELFVAREALRPFCAKLNAWVTGACSGWLMGRSKLEDADPALIAPGWGDGRGSVLRVDRCRFLEASGCASTCINMCKAPTQTFFAEDMGIPLHMEPDYDDFSCTFTFGKEAPPLELDAALAVPCFTQCPTAGALRRQCHYVPEPDAAVARLFAEAVENASRAELAAAG